jgi:membrane-associated protein
MSFVDLFHPQQLTELLSHYRYTAYAVLFLGAFFETLIPFSLAILGEAFFLSGALLAGLGALNIWMVMLVLFLGGILGDNASYWIGRRYGEGLFSRLAGWPLFGGLFRAENYARGRAFFQRRGAATVFIARFSGPFSWVVPALAGAFRLNYTTFLRFNTLGVVLGISQFILLGYFFGRHLETILGWLDRYVVVLTITFFLLVLSGWRLLSLYRTKRQS